MDLISEALMTALYAGVFAGAWLLGKKSRTGWFTYMLGNVAGIALNAYLGIATGIVFGIVNLGLSVRGYLKWAAPKEDA